MAVIEVNINDLFRLLGKNLSEEELKEYLLKIKAELEEREGDNIKIEIKDFNRPDLLSVEGIVRELKGILNIETGIPTYKIENTDYEIIVDKSIINIRPYIACAIVEDVKLGKEGFSSLIQLQEKIMQSFGRKRRKIAIGTHNFDLIEFPIYYKAVYPREIKFVPLYGIREMYLDEILKETETGKKYSYILEGKEKYPILLDSKGEVISFPPIINSNRIGRIDENTKNIFIDVTGTDFNSVIVALNILVTALADRGGKIKSVIIKYPDKIIRTPILKIEEKEFDLNKIKKLTDLDLNNDEIVKLLNKKRIDAEILNGKIILRYLNYRFDLISEYDIVEEIVTAYGYENIEPKKVKIYTKGCISNDRKFINKIRGIMIGIGAVELYTTTLVGNEINKLFLDKDRKMIELINPVSSYYNTIRVSLLSSFMQVLSLNKSLELPASFFEVGKVGYIHKNSLIEETNLLFLYIDSKVSFNYAKSVLERLFKEINMEYELRKEEVPFLIKGRSGGIYVRNEKVGWIGEINPEILDSLEITYPMVGFEISLSKLTKYLK